MMPQQVHLRMKLPAVSANANVTGQGRNVGPQGVGLYKQNDGAYLEFYKLQSGANTYIDFD